MANITAVVKNASNQIESWIEDGKSYVVARNALGKPSKVTAFQGRWPVQTTDVLYDGSGNFLTLVGTVNSLVLESVVAEATGAYAGVGADTVRMVHLGLVADVVGIAPATIIPWDTLVLDETGLTAATWATEKTRIFIPNDVLKIRVSASVGFSPMTPAVAITLGSSAIGTGVSCTAGSGTPFVASDIGRYIYQSGTTNKGMAVITGFTSSTVVTVQILVAFSTLSLSSNAWVLSPAGQSRGLIALCMTGNRLGSGAGSVYTLPGLVSVRQPTFCSATGATAAEALATYTTPLVDVSGMDHHATIEDNYVDLKALYNAAELTGLTLQASATWLMVEMWS